MTKKFEIYKCEICGNMVEIIHQGAGQLVCCEQPMTLLAAKTEEEGKEKHLPVIEETEEGIKVKVGSVPHPMEEKHFIEWIEIIADGAAYRKFLTPGLSPEAFFEIKDEKYKVREYCNIHGLWST